MHPSNILPNNWEEDFKTKNWMLNASPDTTRYLIWSKFVDSIESFKEEIFKICSLMWIHRIELFQLNKEKDWLKVLMSFSMDSEWINTVWQWLVLADNPNFENVAKTWKMSQIRFPWFGIDLALPIWQSDIIVWFDRLDDNRPFTENELLFLKQVGTSIAISYDAGYMTFMNGTDALTKVWNRLALNHYIDSWVDIFGKPLPKIEVIIFFDIDHFRQFNNVHWHHVGDMILQHTASVINQKLSEVSWTLLRYGWEEFVWVLNADSPIKIEDKQWVYNFIDSIRQKVAENICSVEWVDHNITISVWYSIVWEWEKPNVVIREANEAEHTAKIEGRNRTVLFEKKK
jgi:diguanylate cyclase (GGDEF)-like protein